MADEYPSYSVTLEGFGALQKMTGTHAGTMVSSDPALRLNFELTHGPELVTAGQKIPNLILKLTAVPPPPSSKA